MVCLRVQSLSGEITTTLLAGKTKVAPLKPTSVPRLELLAVVLLSRLIDTIRSALKLTAVPCHGWTDSTVALAWLSQHPSKWKTFEAHRVEEVQSRVPYVTWHHVRTDHNPADCASRGFLNGDIREHSLWWKGPVGLLQESDERPPDSIPTSTEAHLEARTKNVHITQIKPAWELASKYPSWAKLVRVTAYIIRFADRCRRTAHTLTRDQFDPPSISANDCQRAQLFWLKAIQSDAFPKELSALQRSHPLSSKNRISPLSPFLDENGLIRVGGRLQNSPLPVRNKHPILLASHQLVTLIIRSAHLRSLHAGVQLTLSTLRREFWILRARGLVKSVIHQCVVCAREKAAVPTQLMGQLPRHRVTAPTRAFLHCGLDYAGSISTRASSGIGIKSHKYYIAIFVCLAPQAVHLELVSGYSTQEFLNAFVWFCARRGLPETMYSDNGTNFTGADRELEKTSKSNSRS